VIKFGLDTMKLTSPIRFFKPCFQIREIKKTIRSKYSDTWKALRSDHMIVTTMDQTEAAIKMITLSTNLLKNLLLRDTNSWISILMMKKKRKVSLK